MPERPAGSDRGRPAIDWEEAFTYYASLPDSERSYQAVADDLGVSVRTVETHGRKERWKERLAGIRADAAEATDQRLAETRAERFAEFELLVAASMTTYAQQLRAGQVKVSPADLLRFFKLLDELWTQVAADQIKEVPRESDQHAEDPEQRKRELIAALEEAGAFERLRTLATAPPESAAEDNVEAA